LELKAVALKDTIPLPPKKKDTVCLAERVLPHETNILFTFAVPLQVQGVQSICAET